MKRYDFLLASLLLLALLSSPLAVGAGASVTPPFSDSAGLGLVHGPSGAGDAQAFTERIAAEWWGVVQDEIRRSEYQVTWQDQTCLPDLAAAYQAPNRAQDLRTYFEAGGIRVIQRTSAKPAWVWGYRPEGQPVEPTVTAPNRIEYRQPGLVIWYENGEAGLTQGFDVAAPPSDGGLLTLAGTWSGALQPVTAEGNVDFHYDGEPVLRFGDVRAVDSQGQTLDARLEVSAGALRIAVEDLAAVYPVTVTARITSPAGESQVLSPEALPADPDWMVEGDQAGAKLGTSVATAGDVNGDGYSDVIVGAPTYDNGQTDEGRAYVYYGSASGPGTTADWTLESDSATALLGWSAGTAGDVNGDGYADVMIGAPYLDNGQTDEGRAYIFHGSLSGLGPTADWMLEGDRNDTRFGHSLGTAGDVNGDGYDDVIVGAPRANNGSIDEGQAFVYLGSATGASTTPAWMDEGNQYNARFGDSVSTAGDVNGDGYADIIVGVRNASAPEEYEGQARVYHGSAGGLSPTPDWTTESDQAYARLGWSVSTAGDVNGDGYSDVVVGAYLYTNDQANEGAAFLFYGSAAGLSGVADWMAEGDQAGAQFGHSVGVAGDVNGDGYADVVVGARRYDNGQTNEGAAYVYYGSASGPEGTADWMAEGEQDGAEMGFAVGTAGDVNGDGHADVIVGMSRYDGDQTDEGAALAYYGSANGLSTEANWWAESDQTEARLGASVDTAGDVNGDGYADVIVGAHLYDHGQTNEGAAFVYHGSPTGLSPTHDWMAEGDQANSRYGRRVSTAGDVNGDGYTDVIIGASAFDTNLIDSGAVFVYYGSAAGLSPTPNWMAESDQSQSSFGSSVGSAGDVNGDGYADVIVGAGAYENGQEDEGAVFVYHGGVSGLSNVADWMVSSGQANTEFGGGGAVDSAGDVNGDGYGDVVVGAREYDNGQTDEGAAFVYYGSVTGLSTVPNWMAEGDQANAYFGAAVSTAGDVDGDGFADLVVGAHFYNDGQTDEGAAFVYHGSPSGLNSSADWMATSDQLYAEFGCSVGTAGDVNGDGYADVIVGARYYSNDQIEEGRAYVYLGSTAGLSPTADWIAESDQDGAYMGWATRSAGDVNGDGYADVIVGSHRYSHGQTAEGRAYVYYGNASDGLDLAPRQMRLDASAPIAPLGVSDDPRAVQLWVTGRMPLGREEVKLQWQVAPLGTPFTATHVISGTSAAWTDVLTSGVVISQNVEGLTPLTAYHWRARLLSPPGNRLGQSAGRWLHVPWNGWTETDFRTVEEPIMGLRAYNDSPTALGNVTTLTATITAGSNVTYTWTLGDGAPGSDAVLTHTYPALGVYTAVVTATNSVSILTATTRVTIVQHTYYLPLISATWPENLVQTETGQNDLD
ncbi:MAG: FG-GAP-like repeat-containing protein [Anaerolineae bacterium]|jgi:hypothetical protein